MTAHGSGARRRVHGPRGHLEAAARGGRPRRRTSGRHPARAPGGAPALGGVGRRHQWDRRRGWAIDRWHERGAAATPPPRAFAAAPGSSLRVGTQPWEPVARPNRSPRPWPATTRATAPSSCGSTRDSVRRLGLPPDAAEAAAHGRDHRRPAGHRGARPTAAGPPRDRRGAGRCLRRPATGEASTTRAARRPRHPRTSRTPRTTSISSGARRRRVEP